MNIANGSRSSASATRVVARLAWEHTHREMLPAVLMLHQLERLGVPAILEHVSALGQEPPSRDVVFLPFYYDDTIRDRYLSKREFRGCWLVNTAYEQMHFRCGRGYLLPDGEFAREQMLHCAWGERFHELLVEHGIPEERIRMTGHPRFDIYHHPELLFGRDVLAKEHHLDPDKPWVLVPYNFNMAFISRGLQKQLISRRYALTQEFVDGFARAREAFTPMVRRLADEFPGMEFILRVHPAGYEAKSLYEGESRARPNLHVIADYDIANWIVQAALTIVWNSTSGMEAMVAGRPVVAYEPFPFSEPFDYDVNRILPTFKTLDPIVDVLRALPEPQLSYDWRLFERWYRYRDGRNIERLCGIVEEARGDYESYASRSCSATNRLTRVGRRVERAAAAFPGGARLTRWVLGLDAPPHHDPPPADAMKQAVQTLSAEPLLGFLR